LPGWQRYWASGLGPYQGLVIGKIAKPAHLGLQNCKTRTFAKLQNPHIAKLQNPHILGAKLQNPHIARKVVQNCKTRTFAKLQNPHIGKKTTLFGLS